MFKLCGSPDHNECVYNFGELLHSDASFPAGVLPPILNSAKPASYYTSRYASKVRNDVKTQKVGGSRTMGMPCLGPPKPHEFLKKQSKTLVNLRNAVISEYQNRMEQCNNQQQQNLEVQINNEHDQIYPCFKLITPSENNFYDLLEAKQNCEQVESNNYCLQLSKPQQIFQEEEEPKKDFIRENALQVVRRQAKRPEARVIDQGNCGPAFNWHDSGLAPKYVRRPGFGTVPPYIIRRQAELHALKASHDRKRLEEENSTNPGDDTSQKRCRHLEECVRSMLLDGLKKKWEEVFQEYRKLPLAVCTAKRELQRELEKTLKEIEKDIQLLERHNHIFVQDNDESCSKFYL